MNEKLKILVINYEFPPLGGGGGVASYDLALEWAKEHEVHVLTSSYKELDSFEVVENIKIHRTKVLFRRSRDAASFISMLTYLITAFFKGISIMRKNKFHVINTHFAIPSGPLGYILGKFFKIPNVLSLHGGDIYDPSKKMSPHKSRFFRAVVNFILNRADHIVAQSSNTRNNTIKYYVPKKNIDIIPLPFHPPVKFNTTKKELGIAEDEYMLISIGRLVKRKALDLIIKALSAIDNEKIKFYILGDGPEREYLENLSRELKIESRVIFLGFVDDDVKYKYLSVADLFSLASLHEGFGIVYMEAMYMGLPILCANNGGQVDFLKNDENAILIDVGDVKACKNGIERFYSDVELYKRCSLNNIEKVKEFYAATITKQYIDIYYKLLE
jgi:L-malate glycosyltransferase